MWWIGLVLAIVAIILGARWAINRLIERAPVCQCNRPDCGGGCWGGDI